MPSADELLAVFDGPLGVVVAGVFGALLGSFLNVCVYRLPRNESIVTPRSRCPRCGRGIAWYDNVPLLSWLALRARCRHCGAPISVQYPLVELAVALIWAGSVAWQGVSLDALVAAVFATLLLGIALTDVQFYVIPDVLSLGGMAVGLLFAVLPGGLVWWLGFVGAALGYGLLWVVRWLGDLALRRGMIGGEELGSVLEEGEKPTSMGEGDLRMMAMVGAFLGPVGVLLTVFLGALVGSLIFLPLRLLGRRIAIPFGVFLAIGAVVALVVGDDLVGWYLRAAFGR
ncbi:MAG: prepilin peptidase [Gemmatimonadales bacterium]|jgi:leader peptidase (prepilin peptidase)/N-methyltransferase